jgi:hypothetical protein
VEAEKLKGVVVLEGEAVGALAEEGERLNVAGKWRLKGAGAAAGIDTLAVPLPTGAEAEKVKGAAGANVDEGVGPAKEGDSWSGAVA